MSFASHFQIKLSTHGSNLNSVFVIMSELELFFLTVLTQNFNTVDLVKILEKNQKLHIEGDVMQNHEQKEKVKKSE
jgi:hypothetical protein